jgi:dGTPase
LRSGLITPLQLAEAVPFWRRLTASLGLDAKHVSEMDRRVLVREMLGQVISDIVSTTVGRIEKENIRSLEDVRQHKANLVAHSAALRAELRELKSFLYANLYHHYRVVRQVHKAEHFLTTLFKAYTAEPRILPPAVQAKVKTIGLERAVCDYLAGMTDRFTMDEYQRLYEPYVRT